jgi:hypothetical protein
LFLGSSFYLYFLFSPKRSIKLTKTSLDSNKGWKSVNLELILHFARGSAKRSRVYWAWK